MVAPSRWNYVVPAIAGCAWVIGAVSATFYVFSKVAGKNQIETANDIALGIAKGAAAADIAAVGLAVIVTVGKAIHAAATRGLTYSWEVIAKSVSPCNISDPNSPPCNIKEPEAIFCNTLVAAIALPLIFALPFLECWSNCYRGPLEEQEGQPNEVLPEEVLLEGLEEGAAAPV